MPKQRLKKLWGLGAHHRADAKEKRRDLHPTAPIDELVQATQDMQEMRNCYDGLLSAAASTANSAYEFSESLRELGTCLLEKTALNDDEESGRALLMLGKLQFELQKLVDNYRSHVTQTISTPSESLLNELRTVEEMKRQCDDKRVLYEGMVTTQIEKGRQRNSKESFSPQQLQDAQQEYEEEATLFVFRLKSLKQGQSRSLLTQAVRHHSSQLSFFRRGIKALETVEPHVRMISEKQHIDYPFSGLEDYETESDNNDRHDIRDDGELSFDYGHHDLAPDAVPASRSSMELEQADQSCTEMPTVENTQESQPELLRSRRPKTGSKSAPIAEPGTRELTASTSAKRFHSYVLPTPVDLRSTASAQPLTSFEPPDKYPRKPPPLAEGLAVPNCDPQKSKRQAFSGPLPSKSWSSKPLLVVPRVHTPPPSRVTGALHELPKPLPPPPPPAGPLRAPLFATKMASPLPRPPSAISRSYSIPSSSQRSSLNAMPLTSSPLVRPMILTRSESLVRETLAD